MAPDWATSAHPETGSRTRPSFRARNKCRKFFRLKCYHFPNAYHKSHITREVYDLSANQYPDMLESSHANHIFWKNTKKKKKISCFIDFAQKHHEQMKSISTSEQRKMSCSNWFSLTTRFASFTTLGICLQEREQLRTAESGGQAVVLETCLVALVLGFCGLCTKGWLILAGLPEENFSSGKHRATLHCYITGPFATSLKLWRTAVKRIQAAQWPPRNSHASRSPSRWSLLLGRLSS